MVLFLNHVLMQEPEAQTRLAHKKGSVLHVRWGVFEMELQVTPAGLLDLAEPSAKPDLLIVVTANTPMLAAQALMAGKTPPVNIEGDVQLAAELGWLAENLRWDVEEDLSRLLGDVPAHGIVDAGRKLADALKRFLAKPASNADTSVSGAGTSAATAPGAANQPANAMAGTTAGSAA